MGVVDWWGRLRSVWQVVVIWTRIEERNVSDVWAIDVKKLG